ncbi:hypothetical protein BGZ83_011806 [Gryganskiella cystojenkinii]|nr:hypothetical protein BGZ83_011806 [Gryganskiella cystojenkinii]
MSNPLDLPEIRVHLAQYLSEHTLSICARVSQSWRLTFESFLWRDYSAGLEYKDTLDDPDVQVILRNAHVIRDLDLQLCLQSFVLPFLTFPNLRSFTVWIPNLTDYFLTSVEIQLFQEETNTSELLNQNNVSHSQEKNSENGYEHDDDDDIHAFLNRHRRLNDSSTTSTVGQISYLRVGFPSAHKNTAQYWRSINKWQNLRSLRIEEGHLSVQDFEACCPMWSKLEDLNLWYVSLAERIRIEALNAAWIQPTKIKSLQLRVVGMKTELVIRMLELCPELESFAWLHPYSPEIDTVARCLARPEICPRLTKLTLDSQLRDNTSYRSSIVAMIISVKKLESLNLYRCWLGCCWDPDWSKIGKIRPDHLLTLREFVSRDFGPHVQTALCLLPNLERFVALRLSFENILNDPRPWVCKNMKEFELYFELEAQLDRGPIYNRRQRAVEISVQDQRDQVLDRIAAFKNLEKLNIGHSYYREEMESLELRVARGLDRLRDLKRIRWIGFEITVQKLDEEDVRWMLKHWPLLEEKQGCSYCGNPEEAERLDAMFRNADVRCPKADEF